MISALMLSSGMAQLGRMEMSNYRAMNSMQAQLRQFTSMGRAMGSGRLNADVFMASPAFGKMAQTAEANEINMAMNRLAYKPMLEAQIRNAQQDLKDRLRMIYG